MKVRKNKNGRKFKEIIKEYKKKGLNKYLNYSSSLKSFKKVKVVRNKDEDYQIPKNFNLGTDERSPPRIVNQVIPGTPSKMKQRSEKILPSQKKGACCFDYKEIDSPILSVLKIPQTAYRNASKQLFAKRSKFIILPLDS